MRVIGVVFKPNGKEYYFSCSKGLELTIDKAIIVDTARGNELGFVNNLDVENIKIPESDLMPILRIATKKDIDNYEKNKEKALQAFRDFNRILAGFKDLEMKLVSAEYSLDQTRLLFMYVSDDRVDFRELLKALAAHFKKRIELKQIGSRDKAKLVGGLGPCGMETCCSRFLKEFDNISINMAKNQMLSLNPIKISGLCGRLLCCLKYENDNYTQEKTRFPKLGSQLEYKNDMYKVTGLNILIDEVKIENSTSIKLVKMDELKWK